MSSNFYFSIIIPTYNRENLIIECIRKLKNQTFEDWECIIVNDGSTDNTKDTVEQEIKKDKRFKLINQPNSERAIARNNGAKVASGKFLIFLDSDDYFEDNHLNDLKNSIQSHNEKVAMYFCDLKTFIKGEQINIITKHKECKIIDFQYFLNNSVIPARVCLHKDILLKLKFDPRAIIVEDTILWIEILNEYPVTHIPIDSVCYVLHESNSVNIQHNNAYLLRLKGLKVLFKKEVGKKIETKTKKKHLNRCLLGIHEYYKLKNKKLNSFYWLFLSLLKYPTIEFKHKLKSLLTFNF
jgi:glycosyltransferase involved in cell wall biosynthesis